MDKKFDQIIKSLFKQARLNGGLDYIYTLVRVCGIESYRKDVLLNLKDELEKIDNNNVDSKQLYCKYTKIIEPYKLIYNLISCAKGLNYNSAPFLKKVSSSPVNYTQASTNEVINLIINHAKNSRVKGLLKLLKIVYSNQLIKDCDVQISSINNVDYNDNWNRLKKLLILLVNSYFLERLNYRNKQKYYKLPNFEVLELLTNQEYGLIGFKIHFSNGSNALFQRNEKSVDCINVMLGSPINFFAGNLDELKKEWRIDNKQLSEIGLPGRYNKLGEWKPIIFPGDAKEIENKVRKLSDNYDIQGILFYIYCTCHHIIEFVVKTPIDLPIKNILTIGNKLFLWKCPKIDELSESSLIYDGWFELDQIEPDYIEAALELINLNINRIGFIYGNPVDWHVKYSMNMSKTGHANLLKKDLNLLRKLLDVFPRTDDSFYLDYAIDWYNYAQKSRNPFVSFLCYYISIESISIAITEGKASLGIEYNSPNKNKRRLERKKCIDAYYSKYFISDPTKFITEAYFNCVVGLKERVRAVTKIIFGENHHNIELLFDKRNGHSLNSIRGDLAHGKLSMLDRSHLKLIRSRLPEIKNVAKEFLSRIIFQLKFNEKVPNWSQRYILSIQTNDPRNTLFASREDILPNKDWRIRAEWCN